jgi:hypothetical protein
MGDTRANVNIYKGGAIMANEKKKQGGYASNGYGVFQPPKDPVKNPVNTTKKTGNDLRVKGGK